MAGVSSDSPLRLGSGPLLVGAAPAGELLDVGSVAGAGTHHVQAFAAVPGAKLEEAADRAPLPLLVRSSAAGELDDVGTVRSGRIRHVQTLAAVGVDDPEVAAARVLERP